MTPLQALAARLEAVAGFVEDGLAAGAPPKYLARQAAAAAREIAATARAEAEVAHHLPEAGSESGTSEGCLP